MKTVVSPDMVAHLWANKAQDAARNSGDTFYFKGPTIYSYRDSAALAHRVSDTVILVNDANYSVTSNKHFSIVRGAMSRTQWENALHVPDLNRDLVNNLDNCTDGHFPGSFPNLAKLCVERIVSLVSGMTGKRESIPMRAAFNDALRYEKTGLALCQHVKQKGKPAHKWPLAALPDSLPADYTARAAWAASVARVQIMETYKKHHAAFTAQMANLNDALENSDAVSAYGRIHLVDNVRNAIGELSRANNAYKSANDGKAMPRFKALQTAVNDIAGPIEKCVIKAKLQIAYSDLRENVKNYIRKEINGFQHVHPMRMQSSLATCVDTITASAEVTGLPDLDMWLGLAKRILRKMAWAECKESLSAVGVFYNNELPGGNGVLTHYVASECKKYIKALENCSNNAAFYALHKNSMGLYIDRLQAAYLGHLETVKAQHAAKLDAWLAGGAYSHTLRDTGTFARIKGDNVETTLGATVPLSHACRLAKIASRVISHGGQAWANGTGPLVGAFRVASIGADGAMVIGCHAFSAGEVHRMLGLLDAACVDCVETV